MILYMTKKKTLTVFVILFMITSGVGGTLFALVMSALIDCVSGQQGSVAFHVPFQCAFRDCLHFITGWILLRKSLHDCGNEKESEK